jgi:hypothetical protein
VRHCSAGGRVRAVMMSTLLLYSSRKEPTAKRKRLSWRSCAAGGVGGGRNRRRRKSGCGRGRATGQPRRQRRRHGRARAPACGVWRGARGAATRAGRVAPARQALALARAARDCSPNPRAAHPFRRFRSGAARVARASRCVRAPARCSCQRASRAALAPTRARQRRPKRARMRSRTQPHARSPHGLARATARARRVAPACSHRPVEGVHREGGLIRVYLRTLLRHCVRGAAAGGAAPPPHASGASPSAPVARSRAAAATPAWHRLPAAPRGAPG